MKGNAPNCVAASLWQTPHAFTLIRTSPAPGTGISRSTSSNSPPALPTCATRFFAIFLSPNFQNESEIPWKQPKRLHVHRMHPAPWRYKVFPNRPLHFRLSAISVLFLCDLCVKSLPTLLLRRPQRLLPKIKTILHPIRRRIPRIDRLQPKRYLAKLHQTHMRMKLVRYAPLRVRADHQATHSRSVAELRPRITRPRRRASSRPFIFQRWCHMVVPPAPIVPGNENRHLRPQRALPQRANPLSRPLGPQLHGRLPRVRPIRRMLGKFLRRTRRIHPRNVRQSSRRRIRIQPRPRQNVLAPLQRHNLFEIAESRVAIRRPAPSGLLQIFRQRWNRKRFLRLVRPRFAGVVDDRRIRRDQHQMVRL